ncbi:alginate lyase family protein [Microbacterium kyungheense]|uniref:Alginate lyase n=1 Tax=Microbacterium kyungheense TaxID=1263636 RepID=A0A543FJT1_9MICO|nr:alginate lyase family protein [Microbacterium kyungheense]TQM34118.1 alginate lyase [Microbacterium kyungheense]
MRIHRRRSLRRLIATVTAAALAAAGAVTALQPAAAVEPVATASPPAIVRTLSDAGFAHPGVGFTADHLENMRTQVLAGVDPWASYYDAMSQTKYAARTFVPEIAQPGTDTPKNDAYDNAGMRSSALRDSLGAMAQALEYVVTGDEQYRANALHVLRTWSGLDPAKYAYFADAHIHTGVPLYYMLIAAEVVRGTEPSNATLDGYDLRWTATDQQRIEDNLVRPVLDTFLYSQNRLWNQHLYGVIGMVAAAIFLDDADLYAKYVEWFTVNSTYESEHDLYGGDVNGALASIFREIPADAPGNTTGAPFVQHMEMLRDQAHGQGDVDILVALARLVDNQGTKIDPVAGTVSTAADAVSPYRFLDDRILAGADTFYAFMMGEEVPYIPASEGGSISQAYRGRLQDPLSEAYLQYRYVAGVDVETEAPHVADLYAHRDGPLYYYGTGIQNFWNDRGSDYTGAEYWVAFPEQLAEVEGSVAPTAPSPELSVGTFGTALGAGAQAGADADGTAYVRLDAAADDAQVAVRRAVWADRSKTALVGVKVRSDGVARLQLARTSQEVPFAEIVVPDTDGQWRYVWLDLSTDKTPGAVGDNIVVLTATGSDASVDVAGVLAQANGVLTPPVFADAPAVQVMAVRGEAWSRSFGVTDAGGGAPALSLQHAPQGASLSGDTVSWTPARAGDSDLLVVASDGTSVTALPVSVTVAPTRPSAIGKLMDRIEGAAEDYVSADWQRVASLRQQAKDAVKSADAATFAGLLAQLGAAIADLRLLNPLLTDGTLDYTGIVTAPALTPSQLRALADGDNQTSWGDQRVPAIVFDFGPGFRVASTGFGFQARDTFPNRAEGTNVYGSDDGATWTLLTEHPNAGQDAAVEWVPVRADVRDQRFRFLKFQVDEPGVPSDPAYPGIWSIADIRIDGVRSEAVGSMDTVTMSSPDGVARRVVPGDHVELHLTGPAGNTGVTATVFGVAAQVTSPAAGQWVASAAVPEGVEAGASVSFTVAFTTPDGRAADPVQATTDGSTLFVSTDEGLVDDAFRGARMLRPDGVVDTAWTNYTVKMFDGDPASHSDTRLNSGLYGNVWDFGEGATVSLTGAELLVRQDGYGTSRIADMRLEGSNDFQTWTRLTPAAPAKTLDWQRWTIADHTAYRYIRLVNGQILNVAELRLFGTVTALG